jgi:hypothetical protein
VPKNALHEYTCHRAVEKQPLVGESNAATLRWLDNEIKNGHWIRITCEQSVCEGENYLHPQFRGKALQDGGGA